MFLLPGFHIFPVPAHLRRGAYALAVREGKCVAVVDIGNLGLIPILIAKIAIEEE